MISRGLPRPWLRVVVPLLFALTLAAPCDAVEKVFLAGAATANITPPLGSSINGNMHDIRAAWIHDELHVRCLVLDDGETRVAFAVVDSCMLPRSVCDEARRLVGEETGLPPGHLLISATHTHSAPTAAGVFQSDPDPAYLRFLVRRITDAVRLALANLVPARIGWGSVQVPDQVFNRRWKMKEGGIGPDPFGGVRDQVRMNPPAGDGNLIEAAGPTDPEVSFIIVKGVDDRPISLMANYSMHYVGMVGPGHVSADYFGAFADRVQELLKADRMDPPFVGIMTNGTSGDCNNTDFRSPPRPIPPYARIKSVADRVASEVVNGVSRVKYHDWAALGAVTREIELGVRLPAEADVEKAKAVLAAVTTPSLQTLEAIYARETVLLAAYPPRDRLMLQVLRVGDLAIAALPCETFVEIGLELKARSAPRPMFTIELANGYSGYLPTVRQHELGGYETWRARSSYLEKDAAPKVTGALMELIADVRP